jgi:hypothetical protein
MAKSNTYLVSFSPAERRRGGFIVRFTIGGKSDTNHRVEASSLATLEAEVRRLAREYGQTCSPYVRLADRKARKPAGFDAWVDTMKIIDVEPAPGAVGTTTLADGSVVQTGIVAIETARVAS